MSPPGAVAGREGDARGVCAAGLGRGVCVGSAGGTGIDTRGLFAERTGVPGRAVNVR